METNEAQSIELSQKFGQVVARAWADDAFKARLLAEPNAVLQEEGLEIPPGIEIRVVENSENVIYLPLPATPGDSLSDEQLEQVSGGGTASTAGTTGTLGTMCGFTIGTASTAGTVGSVG